MLRGTGGTVAEKKRLFELVLKCPAGAVDGVPMWGESQEVLWFLVARCPMSVPFGA